MNDETQQPPRRTRRLLLVLGVLATFVIGWFCGAVMMAMSQEDEAEAAKSASTVAVAGVIRESDSLLKRFVSQETAETTRLEQVRAFAIDVQRVNTAGCPDDFREVYFRYGKAWETYAGQLQAHSDAQLNGLLTGIFAIASGGALGLGALEPLFEGDPSAVEVQKAWIEVQAVAIRHGVVFERT